MLPALVPEASAQPTQAATSPSPPPAAPPLGSAAAAPAASPSGSAPATTMEPGVAPSAEPAPVGSTPPPAVVPAASATTGAPPGAAPAPAPRDEYTGPPLLLTPANKKPKISGYGGLTVAYSHMLHRDGVLIGGEGGMLIEHRLTVGGAGYGFSRTPSGPPAPDGTPRQFVAGYGGFMLRYAVYSDIPLYASFGVLIGGGAVTLAPEHHDDNHQDYVQVHGYFVFQPDASLHVNMTRWLRLTMTAGYRLATSVDEFHYQSDDIGGVIVGGKIEMGWF
jgi:hypothetical protein